jgi:hypothetical protein
MDSWADDTGNSRHGFAGPNQGCLKLPCSARLFMNVWMSDRTRLLVTYLCLGILLIPSVSLVNHWLKLLWRFDFVTKYCVLLFDFPKTFLLVRVVWHFSLTTRLSTHMMGHLGLFAWHTLSHSPCRSICLFGRYHNSLPPRVFSPRKTFFFVPSFLCFFEDVRNRLPHCQG